MDVLQLTNAESPFFDAQLSGLRDVGVDCSVRTVGGEPSDRSPAEYVRFYPGVLRESIAPYDVVHANYGLLGPIALAQIRRPVVLTLWGSDVMGENRLVTSVSRFAARHSDAVVAPSRTLADRLDCSATIVPFGVDTDLFRPIPRAEARSEVGWGSDDRIVLFPYDVDRPVKNYDLARRVVDGADVEADLRTVSGVPYERMPYYMNASDALLVTSTRESGPMVVKEAAACNLPVVSTDVGFVSEVLDGVRNSGIGHTEADLADRLTDVLRTDRRSNGRDAVDVLSLAEMGRRLRTLYEYLD